MHYDILYPNALPGQMPEPGLIRKSEYMPCNFCNNPTQWMDEKSKLYVCTTQHREMAIYHKERKE